MLLLVAGYGQGTAWGLGNQLGGQPSPYLAMHARDPVAWQPWNRRTMDLARRENKLLFVTDGYYACHWCHVMQRESFLDPVIAALLNARFIPVVVDSTQMTALDAALQRFAKRTGGRGGWPLNVFVTPQGYPLFATQYLPPQRFLGVLRRLAGRWARQGQRLEALARAAAPPRARIGAAKRLSPNGHNAARYRQALMQAALARADPFRGGFGAVSKFPRAPQLAALLHAYVRERDPQLGRFLQLTLRQMSSQGLYDHVGGGFFRYTTDPDWHIPHFEKMLADNAQLASLYLEAARVFHQPAYRETAFGTLDFMLAELWHRRSGAFATAISALDGRGRDGGAYLWQRARLQRILSARQMRLVRKIWHLDRPADFAAGWLPEERTPPSPQQRTRLQTIYATLRRSREVRLPQDGKLLASLNGLALTALSRAARLDTRYRRPAHRLREFVARALWRQGRLRKGEAHDAGLGAAGLDDYAYVAAGLLSYARLSGNKADLDLARTVARRAWHDFFTGSGWHTQRDALLATQVPVPLLPDGATPSPSATLVRASLRMDDPALRADALAALALGRGRLDRAVFDYASQVTALDAAAHASANRALAAVAAASGGACPR